MKYSKPQYGHGYYYMDNIACSHNSIIESLTFLYIISYSLIHWSLVVFIVVCCFNWLRMDLWWYYVIRRKGRVKRMRERCWWKEIEYLIDWHSFLFSELINVCYLESGIGKYYNFYHVATDIFIVMSIFIYVYAPNIVFFGKIEIENDMIMHNYSIVEFLIVCF